MNTISLSRSDASVPWGFRLAGGLEDEEPLIITHVSDSFSMVRRRHIDQTDRRKNFFVFAVRLCRTLLRMAWSTPVICWSKWLKTMWPNWRTAMSWHWFRAVVMLCRSRWRGRNPLRFQLDLCIRRPSESISPCHLLKLLANNHRHCCAILLRLLRSLYLCRVLLSPISSWSTNQTLISWPSIPRPTRNQHQ